MNLTKPIVASTAVTVLALGIAAALVSAHDTHSAYGPIASVSGAPALGPFDREADCTLCHQDFDNPCSPEPCNLNTPGGGVEILDMPAGYIPGTAFTIRVRLWTDSTLVYPNRKWGFQLTAINLGTGEGCGTWLLSADTLDTVQGGDPYSSRTYVVHKSAGTRPGLAGPIEWAVAWQPPEVNEGDVVFSVAGNATNGNDEPGAGDFVFTYSDTLPPDIIPVKPVSWGRLKSTYR